MQTTTTRIIREAFIVAIKAIVPTHVVHRENRFRYVKTIDEVPGPTLRNFHIDIPSPALPVYQGTYGSGVEFEFEAVVYVNYGGLDSEEDDSITTDDGAQIWNALQSLYDPALPGLRTVEPNPFVQSVTDHGYRWGAYSFRVRYLHDV